MKAEIETEVREIATTGATICDSEPVVSIPNHLHFEELLTPRIGIEFPRIRTIPSRRRIDFINDRPEGTTALHWIQAKHGNLLLRQAVSSQLDFGELPTGQRYDRKLESYKASTGEWQIREKEGEPFDVMNVRGVIGTRNRDPEIAYLIECSRLKAEQLRHDYDNAQKAKEPRYNTEAKLKKAMGDDYYPSNISPSRTVETSRETTRTKKPKPPKSSRPPTYTVEIRLEDEKSEEDIWRNAIFEAFAKRPTDFDFSDGLYMLVKRPRQTPRVYLVLDSKYFLIPGDDRAYIDAELFQAARSALGKETGIPVQLLPGSGSCRVLSFEQHNAETRVTKSDWVLCPVDIEIMEGGLLSQIQLGQKFRAEKSDRRKSACVV